MFTDEIGVRSWPAGQCWIYAYGADGRCARRRLCYTEACIGYSCTEGKEGWVLGETALWLFTCSEGGYLRIFKDGTLCGGFVANIRFGR